MQALLEPDMNIRKVGDFMVISSKQVVNEMYVPGTEQQISINKYGAELFTTN